MSLLNIKMSLKAKIISMLVSLGVVVGIFVYIYFPAQQSKQALQSRCDELDRLADVLSHSLVTGVQFEDTDLINGAVAGVKNREDLISIEVASVSGTKFLSENGKSFSAGKKWNDKKNIVRVEKAIVQDGQNLGSLKMAFSIEDIQRNIKQNRFAVLIVSFVIIGLGFLFGLYLSSVIIKPIQQVNSILQVISRGEGDITKRLEIDRDDEIGALTKEFDIFIDTIHSIVKQVKENTESVAAGTNEIKTAASIIATGAEEQRNQTSEVAASVQEMTAAILENSKNASKTAEVSKAAKQKAIEGSQAMVEVKEGIENIVQSAHRTDSIVDSLSGRAGQIGDIIEVINDIADQTNLLALNAAIEAARAGEQGRGFAVVADEVRKLAERTTKATAQIEETIRAIQEDTKDASASTLDSLEAVKKGKESTEKTDQILSDIMKAVTEAVDMVNQIAAATEEMSVGAKEIANNVDKINSVTRESTEGIEQMASTAEQLSVTTEELRQLVGKFILKE